eukprot:jgi/Botrbrau1/22921/Bobra.0843s0001.1
MVSPLFYPVTCCGLQVSLRKISEKEKSPSNDACVLLLGRWPQRCPEEVAIARLVRQCLSASPCDRPTARELALQLQSSAAGTSKDIASNASFSCDQRGS